MSNFVCEHCGTVLYDTPEGYVTGCEHYPLTKTNPKLFKNRPLKDVLVEVYEEYKNHDQP